MRFLQIFKSYSVRFDILGTDLRQIPIFPTTPTNSPTSNCQVSGVTVLLEEFPASESVGNSSEKVSKSARTERVISKARVREPSSSRLPLAARTRKRYLLSYRRNNNAARYIREIKYLFTEEEGHPYRNTFSDVATWHAFVAGRAS